MNYVRVASIALISVAGIFAGRVPAETPAVDSQMGLVTIPLWDEDSPGYVKGTADTPTLTVFSPQPGLGNGTAVIVAPGGSYLGLASNLEGRQVADWFASRGVTAFVLKYRLGEHNPYPIPLLDAQRAIRLVRSLHAQFGVMPDRVGMIGFSAGGHLAASAGTLFDAGHPDSPDPIERLSDRPNFLILGYAWLNAMQPNSRHLITYCSMLPAITTEQCKAFERLYTPSLHVTGMTPTTFIFSTSDDEAVPVSASVDFYEALITAGVPAEMHLFRHGQHGRGLGSGDAALDAWPGLMEQWLRIQGLLPGVP